MIRFVDCEKLFVSRVTCILKLTKMHSDILDIRRERERESTLYIECYRMLMKEGRTKKRKKTWSGHDENRLILVDLGFTIKMDAGK